MAESKVTYKELKNARINVDNSVDTSKVYDISADVNVNSSSVESFDQGIVKSSDSVIATFSCYGDGNLNIGYQNVESANQCEILEAVNDFMENVKNKYGGQSIFSLTE